MKTLHVMVLAAGIAAALTGATMAAGPAAAPAKTAAVAAKETWTAQIETMDFKPTAELVLKKIEANQFSGLATSNGAIVVTPAERVLLDRLQASADMVEAHPHDVKLAVRMMSDLNKAAFLALYDSERSKASHAKANERTILNFMSELRDQVAASTSVMELVNVAGSMDQLINQQTVDKNGDLAETSGKPKPWLSPDNAGDKIFIAHLSEVRAKALEALGLAMDGDEFVDVHEISTAVKTDDGRALVGLVQLKSGKVEKGKITKPQAAVNVRTTGKVEKAAFKEVLDKLNDPGMPTGRPRYQDFLQADRRLMRDAMAEAHANQPVTPDVLTFTPGDKLAPMEPVTSWWGTPLKYWSQFLGK